MDIVPFSRPALSRDVLSGSGTTLDFRIAPNLAAAVEELLDLVPELDRARFADRMDILDDTVLPESRPEFIAAGLRWAAVDVRVLFAATRAGRPVREALLAALAGYSVIQAAEPFDVTAATLVAALRHPAFVASAPSNSR